MGLMIGCSGAAAGSPVWVIEAPDLVTASMMGASSVMSNFLNQAKERGVLCLFIATDDSSQLWICRQRRSKRRPQGGDHRWGSGEAVPSPVHPPSGQKQLEIVGVM